MRPHLALLLTVLTLAAGQPGSAQDARQSPDQEPPRQTFETSAELVLVDVTVVDGDGLPLPRLTAGDFELQVNGEDREIASVQFVSTAPDASIEPPSGREAAFSSNEAPTTGRLLLFVVDESNMRVGSGRTVLKTARLLMDRLAPGDLIGLARIPMGQGSVEFTTDRERVATALQRVTGTASISRNTFSRLRISEAWAYDTNDLVLWQLAVDRECAGESGPMFEACVIALQGDAYAMLTEARARAQATLGSLSALMTQLATLRTPINIIMISEGLFVARDRQNMADLAQRAAEARATLHIVRPGQAFFDIEEQTSSGISAFYDDGLLNEGLELLAGQTRGTLTQVSGGSGAAVFERLGRELSGYYLIGFEPTDADRTGRERRIEVDVDRRGVTVRARPTFVIREAATATTVADGAEPGTTTPGVTIPAPEEEIRALLTAPLPTRGVPMRIASYATANATDETLRVIIAAEIGEPATEAAEWPVGLLVLDENNRVVVSNFGPVALAPASALSASPRLLLTSLSLEPGDYTLRLAVVDDEGRTGSVHHSIHARLEDAGGGLAASDLLLAAEASTDAQARPTASSVMDSPILSATIELSGSDTRQLDGARVRVEVAETIDGPTLVTARTGLARRDNPSRRAYGSVLRLGLLPPGEYVARAVVSVPGEDERTVLRHFRLSPVATRAADTASDEPATTDVDAPPAPPPPVRILAPVPSFVPEFVVRPDIVLPFLEGLAALHPVSPGLNSVVAAAREGRYDAPGSDAGTPPDDETMLAFIRGLSALEGRRLAEACAWFQQTARGANDFIGAAFYLGACHAASGRDLDAIGAWQLALLSENPAVVYPVLVDALLRVGDGQGALDFIEEAPSVWTDAIERLRREATAHALMGAYETALPMLTTVLEERPDDPSLMFITIQVLYRLHLEGGGLDAASQARFADLADRYDQADGPQAALVDTWRKFVLQP